MLAPELNNGGSETMGAVGLMLFLCKVLITTIPLTSFVITSTEQKLLSSNLNIGPIETFARETFCWLNRAYEYISAS